ncbi:hypothetical protein NCLIV_040480 [Neospora caninum Liverpool]|uniref:Cyclin 4 n=1 Tax=Neospora caninum (strain Liverpool) TaxID=572307 RepID=F0VBI9_NEOCL|nr:hypothetical protein NCLIV_040480 [Neospora caninum Liverpool]CBZ50973.1 hypothetical protein NCLIV_040480 [Neospora caninum Liverpool]|eukprot:XP_003881006.1 hypothetical protein NCLIV_040480 [Neospora caninum Liverpool]
MANHIVLPPQKLLKMPPSVRDGVPREVEIEQRIYGCHLIQKAGILLKLEAVSIASAQTILHRFFFRRSLKHFDVRRVATAALLLACKLEEDPHRVMHLIGVIHLLSQMEDCPEKALTEDNLDDFLIASDSQEYELFRMDVFRCERYILRELGFMVSQTLVHPHRYILQYIHALFKGNFVPTSQLSQRAWGYLNDSMRTTLCCEVQPAVIAVGSIFLAACDLGIPLPEETGWHELFDVSWEDVTKVCDAILSLYTRPLPSYLKLAEPLKPSKPSPGPQASKPADVPSASAVAAAARQHIHALGSAAVGVDGSEKKAEEGQDAEAGGPKNDDEGRGSADARHANGRDGEAVKKWLVYESSLTPLFSAALCVGEHWSTSEAVHAWRCTADGEKPAWIQVFQTRGDVMRLFQVPAGRPANAAIPAEATAALDTGTGHTGAAGKQRVAGEIGGMNESAAKVATTATADPTWTPTRAQDRTQRVNLTIAATRLRGAGRENRAPPSQVQVTKRSDGRDRGPERGLRGKRSSGRIRQGTAGLGLARVVTEPTEMARGGGTIGIGRRVGALAGRIRKRALECSPRVAPSACGCLWIRRRVWQATAGAAAPQRGPSREHVASFGFYSVAIVGRGEQSTASQRVSVSH